MRWCLVVLLVARAAVAGPVEPTGRDDDAFDFMNLLARDYGHVLDDEAWNVYGQVTWIQQAKLPFHAPYTGTNSLEPTYENSFTGTASIYAGARLWPGAELYI